MRRGAWSHPVMRAILSAEAISALGSQMSLVALPWFVLMREHDTATQLGFVLAAQVLPAALLGIPSAVVVQRLGVRRTLLTADLCRCPLIAAIPMLYLAERLSFSMLLGLVFAVGVFTAPYMSAQRLLIPQTFADTDAQVVQGNALVEGVIRFAMLLGPAVAGVAIMAFGSVRVLYFDAFTFLVAFLILRRGLPVTTPVTTPVITPAAAPLASTVDHSGVLAGVRFALRDPILSRITVASLVFGLFFPPLIASLPVLTKFRYDSDPRVAGLLYSAMGAGALVGTLVVLPFAKAPALRLGAIGAVGLSVPLWLLVGNLKAWQFALVMLVSGLFTPILNAPVISQIALRAPEPVRAKVVTFVLTTNMLTGPIAFALTGPALDHWGLTPVYVVVAVGVTAASALMVTLASVAPRQSSMSIP
ncbi:MAG TPA: MFS transporter [Micromonosporaceae bacterium]